MNGIAEDIVARVAGVLPRGGAFALHEPEFRGNEEAYVTECIRTGWVSTAGAFVGRFEAALADYTGAKTVVAVNTGTAALHACLHILDIGPQDEVLIPALTFIATANAVRYTGATPHLVDVEEATLGVDPARLDAYLRDTAEPAEGGCRNRTNGRRIAALVVMHCFGHPANLDALVALCERWNIALVEDAAESLGSFYRGTHTGRIGRIAALSFNGNKTVTTGGGGAILCEDAELGRRVRHLVTTARIADGWEFSHDDVGFNYRLPNINAALGVAQLERFPEMRNNKRRLADRYLAAFDGCNAGQVFREPSGSESNYWLNALILAPAAEGSRDQVLEALKQAGYHCRPAWKPMHRLPMYAGVPRMDLSVTESLHRRIVNLPSSAWLATLQPDSRP
jgi:perosamine synthetase